MKHNKQKPNTEQDEKQRRTNIPTGEQEETPGKAQDMPPKQTPPLPTDVDEEDEEMDPRRRSA